MDLAQVSPWYVVPLAMVSGDSVLIDGLLMHDYHDREHDVITSSTRDGSQPYKLGIDVYSPQFRLWTTLRGKFLYCTPPAT